VRLPLWTTRPSLASWWGIGTLSHKLVVLVSATCKFYDTRRY
jgi:hypothetical protein